MVNILGNHESTMLEALAGDKAAATDWLFGGGKAGAAKLWHRSGVRRASNGPDRIPVSHRGFLRGLS